MHTWSTSDPGGPEELKAVVTNLVSTSLSHRANSAFKQFGISLHACFCPFPWWISLHTAAVVLSSSQDTDAFSQALSCVKAAPRKVFGTFF